jgi:hypothetical protein
MNLWHRHHLRRPATAHECAREERHQDKEEEYDDATKAILTKKNVTLAFIVVFFVLTAVFMAGAITSSEYEKYLVSDKYKAKLRRLEKVRKANKTV